MRDIRVQYGVRHPRGLVQLLPAFAEVAVVLVDLGVLTQGTVSVCGGGGLGGGGAGGGGGTTAEVDSLHGRFLLVTAAAGLWPRLGLGLGRRR